MRVFRIATVQFGLIAARVLLLLLFVAVFIGSARSAQPSVLRYTMQVAATLDRASVEVNCTQCSELPALTPLSPIATDALAVDQFSSLDLVAGRLHSRKQARHGTYSVEFNADWESRTLDRVATARLRIIDPRRWLWVPESWPAHSVIEVEFQLPPAMSVATPWALAGRLPNVYRVPFLLPAEEGALIVGPMRQRVIEVAASKLRISVIGSTTSRAADYVQWIDAAVRDVVLTFGEFPLPMAQIVVVPIRQAHKPVPFGLVRRGTGSSMILFVDLDAKIEALRSDWTLSHELTHFAHPFFGAEGRWLAEGLAGYYQNVIRANSGALTPELARANLARSFSATAEENERGPLQDADRMRTYWTGAVMALDIDLQLHSASGARGSLATAIAAFAKKHLPSNRTWRPGEYMRELDALSSTSIFFPTYARYARSTKFPEYELLTAKAEDLFARPLPAKTGARAHP